MLPRRQKLLTEPGAFCECPIGLKKWETMKQMTAEVEQELAALPKIPSSPGRLAFGEPSQRFSAG